MPRCWPVVHSAQEPLQHPASCAFFRGSPDWLRFPTQIYARHCWTLIPRPVDGRPHRVEPVGDRLESGIWCGSVSNHFGRMVADFRMRIAVSNQLDTVMPLVFSIALDGPEPSAFLWQILDHLGSIAA